MIEPYGTKGNGEIDIICFIRARKVILAERVGNLLQRRMDDK